MLMGGRCNSSRRRVGRGRCMLLGEAVDNYSAARTFSWKVYCLVVSDLEEACTYEACIL